MLRFTKWHTLTLAIGLAFLLAPSALFAAEPVEGTEADDGLVRWRADSITVDREADKVTARGNVKIHYEGNVLFADEIDYDRATDEITARGNIRTVDRAGNVAKAESLNLSGDMKEGVVDGVRILFSGGERLAAEGGERRAGRYNALRRAVYTACKICDEDPDDQPLWKIKAAKVTQDDEKHTLTYDDAYLELLGVPVLYTPWLRHPDASVKRASGLMIPDFGTSSQLGFTLSLPYFWNIAPNKDLTITPTITTDEGVILSAEYRHRIKSGTFSFSGSGTYVEERNDLNMPIGNRTTRGHLFGKGQFDISDTWRWGFDTSLTSDQTYLRRYDISEADSLISKMYVERFSGRNYFVATAYAFQGLRAEDVAGLTPYVLPYARYSYISKPGWLGGHFTADASVLGMIREEGADTGRLSAGGTWVLPFTSSYGEVYKLTLGVRADGYYTNDFDIPNQPGLTTEDDFDGRAIPYIAIDWRLPFVRHNKFSRQIIEPIAVIVASPHDVNPSRIPNEDSVSFEFDTSNLFAINRYPGLDIWEGGFRVAYGVKLAHYTDDGTALSLIFGQSYRLREDLNFPVDSGLQDNFSDFVMTATLSVPGWFDYTHRMRFNKDSLKVLRNEGTMTVGDDDFRWLVGFTALKRDGFDQSLPDRTELRTGFKFRVTEHWSAEAHFSHDFEQGGGVLTTGGGIVYEDECFRFRLSGRRDFTSDRDAGPETRIGFQIIFKVVGEGVEP